MRRAGEPDQAAVAAARAVAVGRLRQLLSTDAGGTTDSGPPEAPPRRAVVPVDDLTAGSASRARTRLARPHLIVLAVVATIAVLIAGWVVLRSRAVAVTTPLVVTTPAASAGASPSPSAAVRGPGPDASASTGPRLLVHVLGAVRRPGVIDLAPGSRVQDAIAAVGGLRRDADPAGLNLAQLLADGQQIVIGTRDTPVGEVRGAIVGGADLGPASGGGLPPQQVDLNAASVDQLDQLPGVGPVTAAAIVGWRTANGRFSRVEELQEVDGIGPKTLARLAPYVRV